MFGWFKKRRPMYLWAGIAVYQGTRVWYLQFATDADELCGRFERVESIKQLEEVRRFHKMSDSERIEYANSHPENDQLIRLWEDSCE